MIAPKDRVQHLAESPAEVTELARRVRQVSEDLASLWERTNALSRPAWATGWTQPIAGLLSSAATMAEWADKLEQLHEADDT